MDSHRGSPDPASPAAARWLARASFLAVLATAAVLVVFAGLHTLTLLLAAVGTILIAVVGLFWFLSSRGVVRWVSLAALAIAPLVFLGLLIRANLLWVVVTSIVLLVIAGICARSALRRDNAGPAMPERGASPPEHAFLVMNPRSGGGKVGTFDLRSKAEALGAEVALLDGPGFVDVAALTRDAVERGADLLGVAGGDGTQALVAGIAAEHDLSYLVISAGTRNHFAGDLGLDLDDPARCLDALVDGTEIRVDLGEIGGRTFVNNASFGAYAEVVQSPEYRDDKRGTMLRMLPDLIGNHRGAGLRVRAGNMTIDNPQAVLISNGPYETHDLAGLGHRPRIDRGVLGMVTISVDSAKDALGLLRRTRQRGLTQDTVDAVVIEADAQEIPVGVDGEALVFPTPVRCTIRPGALRVLIPRERPGIHRPPTRVDWVRLLDLSVHSPPMFSRVKSFGRRRK
ncbi:diacylglycerol/lipid kinase family protein [Gordonia rubripertincta]|uniref:Diacylglycerol kinase family protein n=1 Tax=Gordonia rubripertincta TaxID=36822 RepID=A0ABT4N151_GORRU|nr:diacylglycerol kinase family protein [Gordonia rubripertincta]MCZ4552987.1 diacylglycerol kinase family protein [Gordonia rubripertincta]